MVQYATNTTTITIAPFRIGVTTRPAGGWGSWIDSSPSPPDESIAPGDIIYTLASAEIQVLRDRGLITDESLVYFKMRSFNTDLVNSTTASTWDVGIPSVRIFKSLCWLDAQGFIDKFSLDSFTLSWLKLAPAMSEAEIKQRYQTKLFDDLTYTIEALNLERAGSTTQTIELSLIQSRWGIDSVTLGNALVSGASQKTFTGTINTITIAWFVPADGRVTYQELVSLRSRALIGNALYIYCCLKSRKDPGNPSQLIDPIFLENKFAIAHTDLFDLLIRLWQRNIIKAPDITNVTLKWLDPVPTLSSSRVKSISNTFLKDAGAFLYWLGAVNPAGDRTQPLRVDTFTAYTGIKITTDLKENPHHTGLTLLHRMIQDDIITVELPQFAIVWI